MRQTIQVHEIKVLFFKKIFQDFISRRAQVVRYLIFFFHSELREQGSFLSSRCILCHIQTSVLQQRFLASVFPACSSIFHPVSMFLHLVVPAGSSRCSLLFERFPPSSGRVACRSPSPHHFRKRKDHLMPRQIPFFPNSDALLHRTAEDQ